MDLLSDLLNIGAISMIRMEQMIENVYSASTKPNFSDLSAISDEKQKTYKLVLDKRSDYEVFMPILMEAGLVTANRRIQMTYLRVNGYISL
jgi:DNA-binding transcriptional ArsR family regulator